MLQQTTVATVGRYFPDFLARWPTVADLAAADLDDVLRAWAGLGYYSRARNLHACARIVADRHGGIFPADEAALRTLPGIGAYTAAAIAAIAFDVPASPVDGNIERVIARLAAIDEPLPGAKPAIRAAAARLVPRLRPGDHAQALMDLGATICTPRAPACHACPLAGSCQARAGGRAADLPRRAAKAERPRRHAAAFVAIDSRGRVLLQRRPTQGLLGGMVGLPTSAWNSSADRAAALAEAPFAADWHPAPVAEVRHVFTHFSLDLDVYVAHLAGPPPLLRDGFWRKPDEAAREALPTLFRKVLAAALRAV
jgi:A/G-specific adenine glycosylase